MISTELTATISSKCISKLGQGKTEAEQGTLYCKRDNRSSLMMTTKHFVKKAGFSLNSDLWDSISIKDEKDVKTSSFFFYCVQ